MLNFWETIRGHYKLRALANMDQTPLLIVVGNNKTYDTTGTEDIWCATWNSGRDKRQHTSQSTILTYSRD